MLFFLQSHDRGVCVKVKISRSDTSLAVNHADKDLEVRMGDLYQAIAIVWGLKQGFIQAS